MWLKPGTLPRSRPHNSLKKYAWMNYLKEVETSDFSTRRDRIAALMAAQPSSNAAHLLAEAYLEGCKLECDAKAHWSLKEIEQA